MTHIVAVNIVLPGIFIGACTRHHIASQLPLVAPTRAMCCRQARHSGFIELTDAALGETCQRRAWPWR